MNNNNLHIDQILLSRIAEGDEQAFSQIVRQYTSIIYHHLSSQVRNHQLAQELTQNIFISLWTKRAELPNIENLAGYIYVMTRNTAYKALLRMAAQHENIPEDKMQTTLEAPHATMEAKELTSVINSGIAALPNRRREVFELSRIENMSYEEIASKLNISRSAVKQHIIAAKVFLRLYLKEQAGIIVSLLFSTSTSCFIFF